MKPVVAWHPVVHEYDVITPAIHHRPAQRGVAAMMELGIGERALGEQFGEFFPIRRRIVNQKDMH
jgi:hypothetical protein